MKLNSKLYAKNLFYYYLIFIGGVLLLSFISDLDGTGHYSLLNGYIASSLIAVVALGHKTAKGFSKVYSKKEEEKLREMRKLKKNEK